VDGAPVSAGQQALQAGHWTEAREALLREVEREPAPEALFGLGVAQWWLGRVEESLRLWERAFAAYQRSRQPQPAVVTAVYLCLSYRMSLGSDVVAQGWSRRAASLVQEHGLEEVAGWVHLCRAFLANDSGSPVEAASWALEAKTLARRYDDTDLELCAVSELGVSLVSQGRVAEGSAMLDEAMAAALAGEASDLWRSACPPLEARHLRHRSRQPGRIPQIPYSEHRRRSSWRTTQSSRSSAEMNSRHPCSLMDTTVAADPDPNLPLVSSAAAVSLLTTAGFSATRPQHPHRQ
jgi:tetratricopeptide (TPR) repeat protein